jgi:hypothetical protein
MPFRLAGLAGLVLSGSLLASHQQAGAFELSGAWATSADMCGRVFTTKDKQTAFTELSDLYGSGFIVEGNRIVAKAARCTIESRKQDGSNLELSAACATSITTERMKFSLKVIDDDTIDRTIDEIPGMVVKYARCKG